MSNNNLNEYRCTRNSPYMHECIGKRDLGARQGHYITATSETEAHLKMAEEFPSDSHGFTVHLKEEGWGCSDCGQWKGLCRCPKEAANVQ